jgi:hypothetical protein
VLTVIVTIMGCLCVVLNVIVTATERSICSVNSYCEKKGEIPVIVTITVKTAHRPPRYCHNNCSHY